MAAGKDAKEITLVVDGVEVAAKEGTMLVDAAKHGDVEIPVFCYEPKLGEPVGACRMCLVEVEGIPKLQTACSTPIRDGMVVYTQTARVKEAQNAVVEFLLVNHPLDCPVCDKGGECPLQDISMGWGPGRSRVTDPKRHFEKPIPLSPLIKIDRERCILCYRCVRFSQEVSEDEQLQLLERGPKTYVGTHEDRPYIGPFHGNIIELCPVGALTSQAYRFRARPWDIEDAGSVCTLCPSQCNVKFTVRDDKVVRTLARDNDGVDDGWLCDKGRFGYQMFASADRPLAPQVRQGGALHAATWQEALDRCTEGLEAARGKVAALVGGGASNEEGYLVQRIVRGPLASKDVTSTSAPGISRELRGRLASPRLSVGMGDIDSAAAVLVVGCDPIHEMPILELRIRKAVRRNGTQLLVASERPTALDGGAAIGSAGAIEAHRYEPGDARTFLTDLHGALARGDDEDGFASALREADSIVIAWGERMLAGADAPATAQALLDLADVLGLDGMEGGGLIEVPRSPNGRGLREVGCAEGFGPGYSKVRRRGPQRRRDPRGPRVRRAAGADPLGRRPRAGLRRSRGLGPGDRRRRLHAERLDVRHRLRPERRRPPPRRDLRREGGDRHPPRRPPPARAPLGLPPGLGPPALAGARRPVRPARRRDRRRHRGRGLRPPRRRHPVPQGDHHRRHRRDRRALAGALDGRRRSDPRAGAVVGRRTRTRRRPKRTPSPRRTSRARPPTSAPTRSASPPTATSGATTSPSATRRCSSSPPPRRSSCTPTTPSASASSTASGST